MSNEKDDPKNWPPNAAYAVPFTLYSIDGKRGAEIRLHRNGDVYFVEQEWVEGTTFKNRGRVEEIGQRGKEIGPYDSLEAAERAAVNSPWFNGVEEQI